VDLLGQLLDPAVTLRGLVEAAEDLVLAQREPVLALERVLEGLTHPGVL